MKPEEILVLLESVRSGAIEPDEASRRLSRGENADPTRGFASVDLDRERRVGQSEVIFGESKTKEHILAIARTLLDAGQRALATRIDAEKGAWLENSEARLRYLPLGRLVVSEGMAASAIPFRVAVVAAGTSDIPVAEEALGVLEWNGVTVDRIFDVGVAGLHRLLSALPRIEAADVVIVLAGMEGALPSVVGGLVRRPLVAVPTSIGYGTAFSGFTALFGMLTGCSAGAVVVNIDNGFGAAMAALKIRDLVKSYGERAGS